MGNPSLVTMERLAIEHFVVLITSVVLRYRGDTFNHSYDFGSLMHYGYNAFSRYESRAKIWKIGFMSANLLFGARNFAQNFEIVALLKSKKDVFKMYTLHIILMFRPKTKVELLMVKSFIWIGKHTTLISRIFNALWKGGGYWIFYPLGVVPRP